MKSSFKRKAVLAAVMAVYTMPTITFAEETIELDEVEVISTTPLKGIGLPINKVPSAVQTVKGDDLTKQHSTSLADFMNNNLMGVSINEVQNNPYQPNIIFRGYVASPLLGTPQGISVFQDGVRINEPFGDVVNWDLIPNNAIASMNVIPGSNPVFGLNTLGGALAITTKNGRTHQGGGIEMSYGSWDRQTVSGEYGGVSKDGSIDYFISANYFDEDGWRDFSPSRVKQVFGKVGWQNDTSRLELSYTGADNDLIGNGLIQKELLEEFGREAINTQPDQTENKMSFLNLNGSHWFNDEVELTGNVYYRKSDRDTLNGDANDDFNEAGTFDEDDDDLAVFLAQCVPGADEDDAEQACSGALNTSATDQKGYGINMQLAFNQDVMGKANQFIAGFGFDYSKIEFNQNTEFGLVNASRGVDSIGVEGDENEVDLEGKTKSYGVFFTDTMSLTDQWHLTLSGRYNYVKIDNDDQINPPGTSFETDVPAGVAPQDETLSGNHSYSRFNPAIGLSYTPTKTFSMYGSYNEAMRAPTSMELGCANPYVPCKLPNSFAADPLLEKVVAKTWEAGARGLITKGIGWTAAVYRTVNHDDLQFIAANATNGMGYFDNVGKTKRQGFDGGFFADYGKLSWRASYSYVDATYQSDFSIVNEVNSSAVDEEIQVEKGDKLANIPEHSFKLRVQYQATPNWSIGATLNRFSEVFAQGNENNDHQANSGDDDEAVQDSGVIPGYTVVNLDTRYKFGNSGWQVFAKAINIFDKEYSSGGLLGENWFEDGQFAGDDEPALMLMPGAPRAGWVGVRYEFQPK